jgi:transcriptional regulator of acetoin/glycerol metabolism
LRRARVDAMLEAYRRAGRNWSRAARLLGISRRTLYNWKREYGLDGSSPDQT